MKGASKRDRVCSHTEEPPVVRASSCRDRETERDMINVKDPPRFSSSGFIERKRETETETETETERQRQRERERERQRQRQR